MSPNLDMTDSGLLLILLIRYDKHTGSMTQLRMFTNAVTWDLDKWMDQLPPELVVDTEGDTQKYLPHVLVMHAQYHEVMIFANHPFFTPPNSRQSLDSQKKYPESARKITQIIRLYNRLWTLRRMNIQFIHPMFTASMVHLYLACTSDNREVYTAAVTDLQDCCNALKEVAQYFELAAWQLRSVDRVRQVWYDLLENHDFGARTGPPETAGATSSPGFDRWASIESVTREAANSTEVDVLLREQMGWYSTWMHIQDSIDVDPFSVGIA